MTILETAILFKGNILCETHFYSSDDILNQEDRIALTNAIINLAKSAFKDKIQNYSLGNHKILIKLKDLKILKVNDEDEQDNDNIYFLEQIKNNPLVIYCIVERNTSEKQVNICMDEAITQFLNQFSIYDITSKNTRKFRKFNNRLRTILQELALKTGDRFKSIL